MSNDESFHAMQEYGKIIILDTLPDLTGSTQSLFHASVNVRVNYLTTSQRSCAEVTLVNSGALAESLLRPYTQFLVLTDSDVLMTSNADIRFAHWNPGLLTNGKYFKIFFTIYEIINQLRQ